MSKEYEYKLSVVVLVYNTELYLEECLDSLVNQTLDDIEIICVNDESTDNSLNILRKYARKYDNIKIINQKNQGGAIAGNNGLKMAKGEYVTLVDSDDIVAIVAYEKLYAKAKETDSDVVGGKPFRYIGDFLREVEYKHDIWNEEKTVYDRDFPLMYYDVFYWDKIYRRSFIEEHDIYMIPNKLYADAPLVFKAFLYANKVTFIPDVVYYWRRRLSEEINEGDSYESITINTLNLENMKDRLVTYYYLKDYFKSAGKYDEFPEFIKLYSERFFYPIHGIIKDEDFKEAYLEELIPILQELADIHDNKLINPYNLYNYFILNNQIDELETFINFYGDEMGYIEEDGKAYWDSHYFRNPEFNIPDEIFEIRELNSRFIEISDMSLNFKTFKLKGIKIPDVFDIEEAKLCLMGLTRLGDVKEENIFKVDFERTSNDSNLFNATVNLSEIQNINIYDIYFEFKYNGKHEYFRIKKDNFINKLNKKNFTNTRVFYTFSKFKFLSLNVGYVNKLFKIEYDDEKIRFIPKNDCTINYNIFIHYKRRFERVYFTKPVDEDGNDKKEFELEWKYSLDDHIPYRIYV